MIELSEEWLTETARRAADEEDAWLADPPTWLDLEDEPSAIIDEPKAAVEADKRWAARFPSLAKRRPRSDIQRWREACARQTAPVFPLVFAATPSWAA
jgi:hypothetical protein